MNLIALSIQLGLVILVLGGVLGWLIPSLRLPCALALVVSSWVVGVLVWLLCFGTVVEIWGMTAAVIGVLIFGIGCMPMAILATLFHGSWHQLLTILAGFFVIYGCRATVAVWESDDGASPESELIS